MKKVSAIIGTYNSRELVENYLSSIREQEVDQDKVEVVVADGGSTDGTVEVVEKYGGKVIEERSGSPEAAKGVALQAATGEYILVGDSDNVLPDEGWLGRMIDVLAGSRALASYPWRYKWRKRDNYLNRYFALLGANDPVAWFLGKADRQSYQSEKWQLGGKLVEEKEEYFVVEYNKDNLPTVGANGFLIRKSDLLKAKSGVENYFHIDVIYDLVVEKPRKFAVVKTEVIHQTGSSLRKLLRKRYRYMRQLYMGDKEKRRYFIFQSGRDELKIFKYVVYSLTLIGPLWWAIKGYRKKRDGAWFMHPVMCLLMLVVYGGVVIGERFKR